MSISPAESASPKELFDVLYARLKGIHDVFIDVVFKATAAFLIVTGWIVTSEVTMKYLQRDRVSLLLAMVGLAVYAFLYMLSAYRTAKSSRRVADRLKEIAYMSPLEYEDVVVPRAIALGFGLANAILCCVVAIFLYRAATL